MKQHGKKPTPWLVNHHARFKAVGDQIEILGYHDMSPEKYRVWLASMEAEKAKLNQAQ